MEVRHPKSRHHACFGPKKDWSHRTKYQSNGNTYHSNPYVNRSPPHHPPSDPKQAHFYLQLASQVALSARDAETPPRHKGGRPRDKHVEVEGADTRHATHTEHKKPTGCETKRPVSDRTRKTVVTPNPLEDSRPIRTSADGRGARTKKPLHATSRGFGRKDADRPRNGRRVQRRNTRASVVGYVSTNGRYNSHFALAAIIQLG